MISNIDVIIVIFFLIITLIVGMVAGKNIKSVKDYAIANHRYGFIPLLLTFLATMVGGDDTTGDLAEFFEKGIIYAIPYMAFIISIILLGKYIAPKIDKKFRGMISVSDIIQYYYGLKISKMTAVIACLATLGYATAQNIALGHLLSDLTGLGYEKSLIFGGCIVILYTIFGGIRSVVITDIMQFCLLIIIIPIICNVAVTEVGGIVNLIEKIPNTHLNIFNREDINEYIALFIIWILPVNYFLPALIQRFLMANSPREIRRICFIYASVLLALLLIMMSLSLSALILYPNINSNEIVPHIIKNLLPIGIKGIAISGMIAVIMSTIDSNLNTSGIILTHNIFHKVKNELLSMRINTGIIGLIALVIALNDYNIINVLVFVQVLLSIGIGIPLSAALLGVNVLPRDFWLCIIAATVSYIFASYIYGALNYMTSFYTLVTGILSFGISCILHNKTKKSILKAQNYFILYIKKIKRIPIKIPNIVRISNVSMEKYSANYMMFGVFSAINYIVPYFMWPQQIRNYYTVLLFMRILAGALCMGLLLREYWGKSIQKYFALYWFFTIFYTLIYMPTVMFLLNNGLFEWLLNIALGIFIMSLLVEWKVFLLVLVLGISTGSITALYFFETHLIVHDKTNLFMGTYLVVFAIIVGLTFSRKRELSVNEKINYLSTLGGAIAHEMRTPLATISTNLEILKEKISQEETKKIINRLFLVTHRANNIVNILLYNLKNDLKINKEKVLINEFIFSVIDDFSMLDEEKQLVKIEYGAINYEINIDVFYTKYVIFNLLKNAFYQRKKHNKGEIYIRVGQNSIEIEDNIIGITKENIKKIFDYTFSNEHEGSGLGLAFCKMAMNEMGGEIECKSNYLQYTKFILEFK